VTAQVLQEYLVSLGFTVDQAKLRSFSDALKGTATSAAKLSAEVVATGVALTEMVSQVAKQFEDLYYMSQRTGATVTNLQAVSFAATQVGVSADEAKGAIESFASVMRRQPGLRNLFQGTTGHAPIGDPEADIRAFVRSQRNVPDYIALQRADALGIGEHTYLQYKNNLDRLEAAEVSYIKRLRDAHLDYAPDDRRWVDFENTLKNLAADFGIVGKRIAEDFRPGVQGIIEDLDKMIERFGKADVASGGELGLAAGAAGATTAGAGIMAILGKIFGFKSGLGLKSGFTALVPALLEIIKKDSEDPKQPLRTGIRQALGIPDPGEPPMWGPEGQWHAGGTRGGAAGQSGSGVPTLPIPHRPLHTGDWQYPADSAARLFDDVVAGSTDNSRNNTFNVNQTNSYVASSLADAQQMSGFTNQSNAGLATALRNLAQKLQ
jgi:hypothetical protein